MSFARKGWSTLVVLLGASWSAWAQLPADTNVTYLIHESAADPNSPVLLRVTLSLQAQDQDGSSIGWAVTGMSFVQPGVEGAADRTWSETAPTLPTVDGLWWVEHADPNAPQTSEFSSPPALAGRAAAAVTTEADLDYELAGTGGTAVTSEPGIITVSLNHKFMQVGEAIPLAEGTAEPVELEPTTPPQGGD